MISPMDGESKLSRNVGNYSPAEIKGYNAMRL